MERTQDGTVAGRSVRIVAAAKRGMLAYTKHPGGRNCLALGSQDRTGWTLPTYDKDEACQEEALRFEEASQEGEFTSRLGT